MVMRFNANAGSDDGLYNGFALSEPFYGRFGRVSKDFKIILQIWGVG